MKMHTLKKTITSFVYEHFLFIALILFFTFLFFYHLDYSTLESWDEAWYGAIAQRMLSSGDYLHMMWNGSLFVDHPPFGVWLMTLAFKLFGVGEFSTRFFSATFGVGTIALAYVFGIQQLQDKYIGFVSGLIIGTSVWFMLRARTGNLDVLFTFFYFATVFSAFYARQKPRLLILTGFLFGLLMLSKTLAGITALVPIMFALWGIQLNRKTLLQAFFGCAMFLVVVVPWYYVNIKSHPDFNQKHFKSIGMRNKEIKDYSNISQAPRAFYFLHEGVRKWYYFGAIGLLGSLLFIKKQKHEILVMLSWFAAYIFPFLSSEQTELWHLIPLYVPFAIVTSYGTFQLGNWLYEKGKPFLIKMNELSQRPRSNNKKIPIMQKNSSFILEKQFVHVAFVLFYILVGTYQVKNLLVNIPKDRYVPDDVALLKQISTMPSTFYLDDDFLPKASFYSRKKVLTSPYYDSADGRLVGLFLSPERDFIVMTRHWATEKLDERKIHYKIVFQNETFKAISR